MYLKLISNRHEWNEGHIIDTTTSKQHFDVSSYFWQAIKAILAFDMAGVVLGWKLFDHAAHLGGALFGMWVCCIVYFIQYRLDENSVKETTVLIWMIYLYNVCLFTFWQILVLLWSARNLAKAACDCWTMA